MVSRSRIHKQPQHTPAPWGRAFHDALPVEAVRLIIQSASMIGAGSLFAVFVTLLLHADTGGYVSVHHEEIARATHLERETVGKALRQLRRIGELHLLRQGNGRRAGAYQIARILDAEREGDGS